MKSLKIISIILVVFLKSLYSTEFTTEKQNLQKISLNGRIHFQNNLLKSKDSHTVNAWMLRRVLLGIKANLTHNSTGEIAGDWAGNSGGKLNKASISYSPRISTEIEFGYLKVHVGQELTTSSIKLPVIERSVLSRYFENQQRLGGKMVGIFVTQSWDSIEWRGSISNSDQGKVDADFGGKEFALTTDFGFSKKIEAGEYSFGIMLASLSKAARGIHDASIETIYTDFHWKRFQIKAETLVSDFKNEFGFMSNPWGAQIMPLLKINESIDFVGRFAYLASDENPVQLDKTYKGSKKGAHNEFESVHSFYFGSNFYRYNNDLKFSIGYDLAHYKNAEASSRVHGIRSRIQLLF